MSALSRTVLLLLAFALLIPLTGCGGGDGVASPTYPAGISVSGRDTVEVGNTGTWYVMKADTSGRLVPNWGIGVTHTFEVLDPKGVAIADADKRESRQSDGRIRLYITPRVPGEHIVVYRVYAADGHTSEQVTFRFTAR